MWVKSHSNIYSGITKESIWRLWADVNNYMRWHDDLDYCRLEGAFAVGNYFMLKPKNAPAVKVHIIDKMTVSQSLKKLVAQGLMKRTEHQQDTRVKSVHLTKKGKEIAKKLVPIVEKVDADFFSAIQKDEYRSLIAILNKLVI